ncbi:hypothetical protein SEA_PHABULOSO_59 [Gordonia phage Phabuloso]|nr:hypothetical protein SEA_PHABULOSO_59 [Gordonia phage Phabuloso]
MNETTYSRSIDGKKVHLSTCRHAPSGIPWEWAEGRSVDEIQAKAPWTKPCGLCKPFGRAS